MDGERGSERGMNGENVKWREREMIVALTGMQNPGSSPIQPDLHLVVVPVRSRWRELGRGRGGEEIAKRERMNIY